MTSGANFSGHSSTSQPPLSVDLETQLEDLSSFLEVKADSGGHPFAHGGYSSVFLYKTLNHSPGILARDNVYAVKAFRYYTGNRDRSQEEKLIKKLKREISTWISLHHPNILRLHGMLYMSGNPIPCLVSDFMENGTAVKYVEDAPTASLIHLLQGTARGLSYIHGRDIVHGDIKGDNILVTKSGDALVGDFGLSRVLKLDGSVSITTSDGNRAGRWTAVEYLDFKNGPRAPAKAGDVWSYGCTALQLLSGMLPYYDIAEEARVVITIEKGELPKFPPSLKRNDFEIYREGIIALCYMCWVKDPGYRPSIDIIASFINSRCFKGETCDVAVTADNDRSIESDQNAIQNATQLAEAEAAEIPGATAPLRHPPSLSTTMIGELIGRDIMPWSEVPPPLSPSIESTLERIGKSARVVLNEYYNGLSRDRLKYEYGSMTIGSTNIPVHTVSCSIEGREYGLASVRGKKKEAEELAALRALERLRRENPFKIPALRYLPTLIKHISAYQGFEWDFPVVPELEDNKEWVHTVTLRFNGVDLGVGVGPTRDDAHEKAAQNAAIVWRGGFAENL